MNIEYFAESWHETWHYYFKLTQIGNIIKDIQLFVDSSWRYSKYG